MKLGKPGKRINLQVIVLVTVRSDWHREPQGTLSALFCLVQDGGFFVNYQPQREQQFAVLRGLGPVGRTHPNANFQICLKTSDKNRCHQSLLSDISFAFFAALKVVMIRCLFLEAPESRSPGGVDFRQAEGSQNAQCDGAQFENQATVPLVLGR